MEMLEDGEDPFVPALRRRPQTGTENSELEELKSLVRIFLREIEHVPFRAVDCDQEVVKDLTARLKSAVNTSRTRKATRR